MESDNQVDLIGEVDNELKYLNTPTKSKEDQRTQNSGYHSTPDDLSKKQIDFKINISCIDNCKKGSPSVSINHMLDKTSHELYGYLKSSLSSNQFLPMESSIEQLCGYHQKPLDVVCIRDLTLICSNCALFGVHKGHQFKSLLEVNKDKIKIQNSIQKIIQDKHQIEDTIRNSNDQAEDINKIQQRKSTLIEIAKRQYQKLRDIINSSEQQFIQLIEQQAIITEERILNQNKMLLRPFTSYHTWQHKAVRYLECLQSPDRFEQQIVMLNYDKSSKVDIIHEGEQVISQIKKNITKIKENKINAIQQFEISVDNSIPSKIKQFISLPSFKSISNKLIRTTSNANILGDSKRYTVNIGARKSIVLEQDSSPNIIKRSTNTSNTWMGSRKPSRSRLDQSFEKRNSMRSPEYSPNNSSRKLDNSREKKFKHSDYKLNQKYSKVYDSVLNDSTQIVELMHADLPNQAIIQILRLLPQRPRIKVLKFNGNKLTDQIAPELWNNIKYISNLNLSGNMLTDGFVASMSTNTARIRSLKTIVLSQNKINSRNVKSLVDEVRKMGITVSI